MVTVKEVDEFIANTILDLGEEKVNYEDSLGRVLKQQVVADRDFPPFDRAMMDGIAIKFSAWHEGNKTFNIEGLAAAGTPQKRLNSENGCLEVMTGAVMPDNTDTVIKYEDVNIANGNARIRNDHIIQEGQHIHIQGADRKKGAVLLDAYKVISPAEIAILATVGVAQVLVAKLPKIAVVATGDELVNVKDIPLPHQIRKSNVHSMIAALQEHKYKAQTFHFIDNKINLREGLQEILNSFDVVVLSGGVSKGKLDYIPEILAELGVEKKFHFVKQRPGKPFWFGQYKNGVVFALPGNPVSTFVGITRYVIPFLYRNTGVEPKVVNAVLAVDFTFKPDLTYFLQVKLNYSNQGQLLATPVPGQGSGDLANLVETDAFIELPNSKETFKTGEVFKCYMFRKI